MADIGIKLSAQDNTKAAFDSVGRNLGNIQTAATSVAGALAGLGVGISVGGFVAMTKAIVDGLDALNDIKDATGASIENISALEDVARRTGAGLDVVGASLIKLNQGLNAAKPGSDTEAAIKAIGLSVKDLKALDPAEAFRQIAVNLSGFADDANKARLTQELFGKSLKEVAPLLKDLAESGELVATVTSAQADEAERFNRQLFNLQANTLRAGRSFVNELLPALSVVAEEFSRTDKAGGSLSATLGSGLKTALDGAVRVGAGAAFVFKNIAREVGGVVAGLGALNEGGGIFTKNGRAAWSAVWDARMEDFDRSVTEYNDLVNRVSSAGSPSSSSSPAVSAESRPTLNIPDQNAAKAAAAGAAKALADQNREIAAQNKLIAENAGLTGSFTEDWNRLTAIYTKGGFSLEQYTEAQAKLLANQPAIKANVDAEAKAMAAIEKANMAALESRLKYVASLGAGLDKLQQETASQQEYVDRLGLSKEAVAALDAAKLESQAVILDLIAIKELDKNLDEEQYDLYKKQSAELRKQAALKIQGSTKEAQLEIEKEITAERKRGWEETDRIARDVFTSWATDGSNAAQKIGDTLKKALLSAIHEATIKPIVLQIYSSVTGGSGGAAGSVLSAVGGGGSAGGMGGLNGLSSLYSMGKSAIGTVGGWLGMGGASAAAAPLSTGMAYTGAASNAAFGAATAGNGAMAGLASIPVVGWIAMGMMASAEAYDKGFRADDSAAPDGTRFSVSDGGVLGTTASFADRMLQGLGLDGKTAGIISGSTFGKQVVYSLLGGYKISPAGGGISGTLSTDGASAQARTDYTQDHRGFLGIGSYTTKNSSFAALDGSMQAILDGGVKATTAAVQSYASAIGLSADAVNGFTQSINIDLTGLDADGVQKKLLETFSGFGDAMVTSAYGSALDALSRTGETSTQTLERLAGSLGVVNANLKQLGIELLPISVNSAGFASGLVDAFGGVEKMQESVGAYYDALYSDSEKSARAMANLSDSFAALGVAVPASKEEFRTLVESIDGTTASGASLIASLIELAPAFDQTAQAAVTAANNMLSALQNYGTSEEVRAFQVNQIGTALRNAGIEVDDATIATGTREQYRAAYEMYAAQGNTRATDALMAQQQAFANITQAAKATNVVDVSPMTASGDGGASIVQDSALTAWQEATDAIVDAMRDLRVTLLDSGPDSFAKLQAQFVIETASAKAGNVAAAQELPELVRSLADASKDQFTSGVQRDLFIARLIQSLGEVAGVGDAGANLSIPRFAAGGYHRGGWAIVGEEGPELVNMPSARVFNANDTRSMLGGGTDPAVLEELRALRAAMDGIRASNNSIAASSSKTAQVLDTASKGGQPIGTKVIT